MIFKGKFFKRKSNNTPVPHVHNYQKLDVNSKNLEKLKLVFVVVKKGHGVAINDLLIENGVAMTVMLFAEGTKEKYVMDILGGEEKNKEMIVSLVPFNKYDAVKNAINNRFNISSASKGFMFSFDITSMAGVFAYKYLTDFGGAFKYEQ